MAAVLCIFDGDGITYLQKGGGGSMDTTDTIDFSSPSAISDQATDVTSAPQLSLKPQYGLEPLQQPYPTYRV